MEDDVNPCQRVLFLNTVQSMKEILHLFPANHVRLCITRIPFVVAMSEYEHLRISGPCQSRDCIQVLAGALAPIIVTMSRQTAEITINRSQNSYISRSEKIGVYSEQHADRRKHQNECVHFRTQSKSNSFKIYTENHIAPYLRRPSTPRAPAPTEDCRYPCQMIQ